MQCARGLWSAGEGGELQRVWALSRPSEAVCAKYLLGDSHRGTPVSTRLLSPSPRTHLLIFSRFFYRNTCYLSVGYSFLLPIKKKDVYIPHALKRFKVT